MNPFDTSPGATSVAPNSNPFDSSPTPSSVQPLGSSPQTQALIQLAHQNGGAISAAVDNLVHPQTSLLSTIGNGFKNAFSEFTNALSLPLEVIAGAISAKYSIPQAIDMHIKPSDVIFGKIKPNNSTLQKVGNFFVRTGTDVLLDPLTYVTFGASSGSVFGARALSELTLEGDKVATVTRAGQDVLGYLDKIKAQQAGLTGVEQLTGSTDIAKNLAEKTGMTYRDSYQFTKGEMQTLMKNTISGPLDRGFAKNALSTILKNYPQLGETLIDKGGIKYFGKTILSGQRISAVAQLVPGMKWLDSVTEQSRLQIGALFNPAIVKTEAGYQRLPPEFVDFQRQAQDLAAYTKEDRIRNIANIVKANKLTANEGKFLMASVEAGKLPADSRLANAYKQLLGFNNQQFQYLKGAGIDISRLDNHAPHVLVDSGIKLMPFKLPPSEAAGAAMKRTMEGPIFQGGEEGLQKFEQAVVSKNQRAIDDAVTELKRTGFEIFDDNLFSASVSRSIQNVRSVSMKQFIDSLAKNYGAKLEDAVPGYRPIEVTRFKNANEELVKMGMAGNQMVFHPAVAKRIEDFVGGVYQDGATQDFLGAYDKLQNLWKASVTSIFPAFHGRNAISNVLLNYNDIGLQALNPATHAMSAQIMGLDYTLNGLYHDLAGVSEDGAGAINDQIHDIMSKTMFTDTHGNPWSFGELRDAIKKNNIALRDDITGQVDVARTPEELANSLIMNESVKQKLLTKANPFSQDFKPYEYGRKVGNAIEGNARLVNFITNLKNTGDVGLATARTKQFLFDYQYLTPFEKNLAKRLIPFYTFMKKNLEEQATTLLTAPGRTAAQLTAVTNLGDLMQGGQLSPTEEAALPDWIKNGIQIVKSKDGNKAEIFGSLGTPVEAPFQQLQPNQFLSSMSPMLTLPLEEATGYDFFQGKPISETTNAASFDHAPQFIKDFIGYTPVSFKDKNGQEVNWSVSLRPDRMHLLLNLPPTSRVLSAMKQIGTADVGTDAKLMQQLVGARPFEFDLEQEQNKRESELQSKLESLLSNAGLGYQLQRFIPQKN